MKTAFAAACAALAFAGLTTVSHAQSLTPIAPAQKVLVPTFPALVDTNFGATASIPFRTPDLPGTPADSQSWIYGTIHQGIQRDYDNGPITFFYRIDLDHGSQAIAKFTLSNWQYSAIAIGQTTSQVSLNPMPDHGGNFRPVLDASYSSTGDKILFTFGMLSYIDYPVEVIQDQSTDIIVIRTTATDYNFSGVLDIQDGADHNPRFWKFSGLMMPVPEPSTNALIVAGLGLMGFVVRRRRKAIAQDRA